MNEKSRNDELALELIDIGHRSPMSESFRNAKASILRLDTIFDINWSSGSPGVDFQLIFMIQVVKFRITQSNTKPGNLESSSR